MKDEFVLHLHRFDSRRITFDTGAAGGWVIAAVAGLAWLGVATFLPYRLRDLERILDILLAILGLTGVLFALWRDQMVSELEAGRWRRRRGFWPFTWARKGSLDDLKAVVLSRSRQVESDGVGDDFLSTRSVVVWKVVLDFFPAPGKLRVYSGEKEAPAYAALARFAKALNRPAIDCTSGVSETIPPERLDGGVPLRAPASAPAHRPVSPEPPPGSGIRARQDPSGVTLVLPREGLSRRFVTGSLGLVALALLFLSPLLAGSLGTPAPGWLVAVSRALGGRVVWGCGTTCSARWGPEAVGTRLTERPAGARSEVAGPLGSPRR